MRRATRSLAPGLIIGLALGLYFGLVAFPQAAYRSPLSGLAPSHRDDYTVMIAAGHAVDRDLAGALERLSRLDIDDIPLHVGRLTGRVINTAARDPHDIRLLVGLTEALGQLTPEMQPFLALELQGPGGGT